MFAATFVLLVFINLDKAYSQKPKGEDDRIVITVDSIERADLYPERLKGIYSSSGKYRPPSNSNDFVFIHVIIVEKSDLKIEASEIRLMKILLIDDKGETYAALEGNLNITVKREKSGFFVFEMPEDKKPVQMKYSYQYREEPPKPQGIMIGQIDITLL